MPTADIWRGNICAELSRSVAPSSDRRQRRTDAQSMAAYVKAQKNALPEELQRLLNEATKYEKRWPDEPAIVREASFIRLSRNGSVLAREYLSAGMSVYLYGIATMTGTVEAYGAMGGLPAIARVANVTDP